MSNSRWIFQTLILSATLNVVLIGVFFYFLIRDNPLQFSYARKEIIQTEVPSVRLEFLERLPEVSFEHLLELLDDDRKMACGLCICDLALGALATFHDFDVERGLGRGKLSKHLWQYQEKQFFIFPGLRKSDFETLKIFVKADLWPFTVRGLFKKLKTTGIEQADPSLVSFFCRSTEFVLLETLFARTCLPIQRRTLLKVALEGGWENFSSFTQKQKETIDFSDEVRQQLLLAAVDEGSHTAAHLFLVTDASFAVTHLDDDHIKKILDLMPIKTQESIAFAQAIASSMRIEPLRKKAVCRISEYTGNGSADEMAGHFVEKQVPKNLRPVFRETPPAAPNPSKHIVQDGESLWLIARKHNVSLDALMEANQLKSTVICPGKVLTIPK
jgi:LysM domain